jgi:hypothetical protein
MTLHCTKKSPLKMSIAHDNFQQYFSSIVAVSVIGGGNPEYLEKTTELLQVTDKLYHIMNRIRTSQH